MKNIKWLKEPEKHDYPSAFSYLSLIYDDAYAETLVKSLRKADVITFKARDIFRASGLPLVGLSNKHLKKDQKKIKYGVALSPILLVRDTDPRVIIADGYHRLCAVYTFDEDSFIPCKIT